MKLPYLKIQLSANVHRGPVINTSLSKTVYLGYTVLDSQWSVLQKSLKIHKTSQTKSQFELTPTGISHWKVLLVCPISGTHPVILKNAEENMAGDN